MAVTLVLWASAFVAIRHLGKDVPAGALAVERSDQKNVKGYRKRADAKHRSKGDH